LFPTISLINVTVSLKTSTFLEHCLNFVLLVMSVAKYNLGFYLYEPDSLTVCNSTCPAGQFASELELAVCILCDSTKCLECVNSSSICTVCHPNVGVWLFNATCMTQCPDGYEANNITFECDKCSFGKFSF